MKLALFALTIFLSGCSVSGKYRSEGPCRGFHKDPQACERAHENSLVAGRVELGQTTSQVRKIMKRDPERRSVNAASETWWYLTDYSNQKFTVILFTQDAVSEIRQADGQ